MVRNGYGAKYIWYEMVNYGTKWLWCKIHVMETFVTDISASTGRNDFIFDMWLWHGDFYVSPLSRFTAHLFLVYRVTYKKNHVFMAFSGNEC